MNRVCLFAGSSVVGDGAVWTDGRPVKVVAARMTALARAADQAVKGGGLEVGRRPEMLFKGDMGGYDFLIRLEGGVVKGGKLERATKVGFKNLQLQARGGEGREMVGFDPVQLYVDELRRVHGEAVLLFYGGPGCDVVAGLWNQVHTGRRKWKIRMGFSTVPVGVKGDDVEVEMNNEAILAEMARLGGDMVKKVEMLK
ncbi:hypothetical protein LTS18_000253 [Coniosporium uncinatum]|uniref:Uncharacterized protein n=1 Tax=Coniosporium uncinatum TaxID=93489 RepID=A0ACC3DFY9_9PEZI|nr:hypothetical protein LTS18_000253 [Coniosporium uncinatum]